MLTSGVDLPLEQYRAIVAAAAVMIWRSDTEGKATYLNEAWQQFTGRPAEGDLGHNWAEAVHPDDRARCVQHFLESLRARTPFEMEYRIRRFDGEYRWCLDRASPYEDADGRFAGFIGTIVDIHEQHAAREHSRALADQAAIIRTIATNATASLFMMDPDGRCTFMNPAAETMTGFTFEEVKAAERQGKALHDVIHHTRPDGTPYPMAACPIDRALPENARLVAIEEVFVHKSGAFYPVLCSASPISEDGRPIGTVLEVRDVTLERRAQEEIEYQAQIQQAITEHAVSALIMVDREGRTTYLNPAATALMGWTLEELRQVRLHEAIHNKRPDGSPYPAEECTVMPNFDRGEAVVNQLEWLVHKNGTLFPVVFSLAPLRRGDEVVGAVYEFRDVTEQRRSEEALREADRRKDQFLAILGHELRNPIATIQNAMQVITRHPAGDADASRMHAIVLRQAEHLHRLVDDLLDVARIQTGKISLARATLDLRDIARAVVDAAQTARRLEAHRVSVSVPADPVWVDGDRGRLEQLLGNFLDNAVKFTPAGRAVRLGVDRRDGQAVMWVSDEGPGIDPGARSRLFQLFAQADQPLDRPFGGLGVGLALARAIAELHGGDVRADSEGPGRGTTFTASLPLARSAPRPEARSSAAGAVPARRILLVEDNADARAALAALLEDLGHAVSAFAGGREAIANLHDVAPHVAFVDVGLPEMDGYAVARAIRANGGASIRLVALTGYGQPQDVERAMAAGFDAHVTKPAAVEQLEAQVAQAPAPAQ